MSKSKANFYTLGDLQARGASPAAVRLELTKTHYRSNANFTFQGLRDSQRLVDRWSRLENALQTGQAKPGGDAPLDGALQQFRAALWDDLNVAAAIGALNVAVGSYTIGQRPGSGDGLQTELDALRTMLRTLGVLDLDRAADTTDLDEKLIASKISERNAARTARDWTTSDRIRDELAQMGVAIKDGPDGTTWTRIVRDRGE